MDSDSQSPTRFPQPDSHATPQIGRAPYRIPVSRDTQPAHHLIHNEVLGLVRKWRFASVFCRSGIWGTSPAWNYRGRSGSDNFQPVRRSTVCFGLLADTGRDRWSESGSLRWRVWREADSFCRMRGRIRDCRNGATTSYGVWSWSWTKYRSVASDVMASAVPANEDPLPVASREVELEGSELG